MSGYTDFRILPNGNLLLTAANAARSDYAEVLRDKGSNEAFNEMLQPFRENGQLYEVLPEWIAALTSAPIITDDLTIEDDGTPVVHGRVWWFPNYCITDPMAELFHKGRVEFTLAESV